MFPFLNIYIYIYINLFPQFIQLLQLSLSLSYALPLSHARHHGSQVWISLCRFLILSLGLSISLLISQSWRPMIYICVFFFSTTNWHWSSEQLQRSSTFLNSFANSRMCSNSFVHFCLYMYYGYIYIYMYNSRCIHVPSYFRKYAIDILK